MLSLYFILIFNIEILLTGPSYPVICRFGPAYAWPLPLLCDWLFKWLSFIEEGVIRLIISYTVIFKKKQKNWNTFKDICISMFICRAYFGMKTNYRKSTSCWAIWMFGFRFLAAWMHTSARSTTHNRWIIALVVMASVYQNNSWKAASGHL